MERLAERLRGERDRLAQWLFNRPAIKDTPPDTIARIIGRMSSPGNAPVQMLAAALAAHDAEQEKL